MTPEIIIDTLHPIDNLRDAEFYLREVGTRELSKVPPAPENEFAALMEAAPGCEPAETLLVRQVLRETIVDGMDELSPQDQFILTAIHSERISIRELATRLGLEKSQAHRLLKAAEANLANILSTKTLIRERLHMDAEAIELSPPKTWDEAAARIVNNMYGSWDPRPINLSEKLIERKIETLRDLVNQGHVATKVLAPVIYTIGTAAAEILVQLGLWAPDEIIALLCRKQHDYGHDNINSFGAVGVAVRDSDKVARYFNLKAIGSDGKSEPFVDALLDMVGYAVIGQMLSDGTFNLDLDSEMFS